MSRGIMLCGNFVTKNALITAAALIAVVLIAGCSCLGIGLAKDCFYYDYNDYFYDICLSTRLQLIINGGILMSSSVIGLVVVAVMACNMREPPALPRPTTVAQPYAVSPEYGVQTTAEHPLNAALFPRTVFLYPQASRSQRQQHPSAATTSAGGDPKSRQQDPTHCPQKHIPEDPPTTDQPPTYQP